MKKLTMWNIIWMNVTAIIGLRWLPMAAMHGASSFVLWLLAAVFFFLPLGLITMELTTAFPNQGGMYVWVKKAFGEKYSFLTAWIYWANSFFYGPSLMMFVAVSLAFVFNPMLATNKLFVLSVILIGIWGVTFLNFHSNRAMKILPDLAGPFGTILPGLIIIVVGFGAVLFGHHAISTDYSLHNWMPNFDSKSNIAFLSTLMFSMAGIELTTVLAGETENPRKTFFWSTVISAVFIVGLYVVGTLAINFLLAPEKVTAASGILDALKAIELELHLPYLTAIVALLFTFGNIGGISLWSLVPIKMLFESTKGGILPQCLIKLNEDNIPARALVVQSAIVSLVTLLGFWALPTVNMFYEILALMTTIIYFIPYLFLFAAFVKLRKQYPDVERPYEVPGGMLGARIMAIIGFVVVLLAIALAFIIPPNDITSFKQILFYRLQLIFWPVFFCGLGLLVYKIYEWRKAVIVN